MGADLYINPYYDENRKKYEKLFEKACKRRDAHTKGIPTAAQDAQRKQEVQKVIQANGHPLTPSDRLTPTEEELLRTYAPQFHQLEVLQNNVNELCDKMDEVGYFRDSYNGSSLFWKLGLSWWAMANIHGGNKKVQLINSRGFITPKKAAMLLVMVKAIPIQIDPDEHTKWMEGTTHEDLVKFFTEKRERFIKFIEFAIEKNKSIYASV